MDMQRFIALLNGPLAHPIPMLAIGRLQDALWDVVAATGEAGERALEEACRALEERDRRNGEDV